VLGLPVTAVCFAFGWITRYLLPGFELPPTTAPGRIDGQFYLVAAFPNRN
jgi:hypothetical protein